MTRQDPGVLLKQATAKKRAKDWQGAIQSLRQAYAEIAKGEMIYPIATFLRLPSYLHSAGLRDEAWRELNQLLVKGYPNQMKSAEILPMDHSQIYETMRLTLQSEGKIKEAVKFGVMGYLSWQIGLKRQGRTDEINLEEAAISNLADELLRNVGEMSLTEAVTRKVFEHLKGFPQIDMAAIGREIDRLVLGQSPH